MTDAPKIPALHLEQFALGELSAAQRDALQARLGDAAAPQLAALQAANAEILAAYPPAATAAEIRRRAAARRSPARRAIWFGLPALATAAVVVVVLWPDPAAPPEDAPSPFVRAADPGGTRIKGLQPHLTLHRQTGDDAIALQEPAEARAHDVLQVSYVAAGAPHGVVASLDGRGVATLHFPEGAAASTALTQGGAIRLAHAYELDEAPGFERFVLVTAAAPIDPDRVLAALRELADRSDAATRPLALPDGWQQSSFLVRKVER